MNTYDGRCGSCVHLNTNDYVTTKDHCYCTYRRQYYDLNERKCSYYEYDRYKDYYDLNHRWHIVSAICNKLGLSDDYECVSLLHNFRVNFLEKNGQFDELLKKYDIIGPVLAECITNDRDSKVLCQKLIEVYLCPALDCIKSEQYVEALHKYLEMINTLYNIYSEKVDHYVAKKSIEENKKTR